MSTHALHSDLHAMARDSLPSLGQSISVWNDDVTKQIGAGEVVAIDSEAVTIAAVHDRALLTRIPITP